MVHTPWRHDPAGMRRLHRSAHAVCIPQVGVEIWPARAEVCFSDERGANPAESQVRFEALTHNARQPGVLWEVRRPAGGSGFGSIDATGLYHAPQKGSLASGTTDVVVATSIEDPLRKAYAWVTLLGDGPAPDPTPRLRIWPRSARLYYSGNQSGADRNQFIDQSNKFQIFRATLYGSPSTEVAWTVEYSSGVPPGTLTVLTPSCFMRYELVGPGIEGDVVLRAALQTDDSVHDRVTVSHLNYWWP